MVNLITGEAGSYYVSVHGIIAGFRMLVMVLSLLCLFFPGKLCSIFFFWPILPCVFAVFFFFKEQHGINMLFIMNEATELKKTRILLNVSILCISLYSLN